MLFKGGRVVEAAPFEGMHKTGKAVGDEGQAAGGPQLVKELGLLGAGAVGAGFDFDAEKQGVGAAEAQNIGYAAPAVGMRTPLVGFGVIFPSVGLAPGAEAVGIEVG